MVKLRHYTDEVSGLIAFICFMFNAAIIDFNPIELSIFFIIFGICTHTAGWIMSEKTMNLLFLDSVHSCVS